MMALTSSSVLVSSRLIPTESLEISRRFMPFALAFSCIFLASLTLTTKVSKKVSDLISKPLSISLLARSLVKPFILVAISFSPSGP